MKNKYPSIRILITLLLLTTVISTQAQNILYSQGFEGSPCENWNFAGGTVAAGVHRNGVQSGRVGYQSNLMDFSSANVAGYADLTLSIYHSVKSGAGPGMDTREGALIQISIDGGPFVTIASVGGYGDANWGFGSSSGGANTGSAGCTLFNAPNPVLYNLPAGTSAVRVRIISVRAGTCNAFNNAMANATPNLYDRSDEGFYIDDVQIRTSTPLPGVKLLSDTGTDNQVISDCRPAAITDIVYSTGQGVITVTGLPPGVTGTYNNGQVTISGTVSSDGVYNYTVKNTCTDSSAMGTITKTTPVPVNKDSFITACNSITFNGINYTSSAIVKDTLKNIQGCDSIFNNTNITILTITPVTVDFYHTGCNSVVYNGTAYTSSTIIRDTIKSYLGCDSVYNIHNIIVSQVVPVTYDSTLNSCTDIIFNGTTYTTSTILRDTTRSFQGCDSLYHITHITIVPVLPATLINTLYGCDAVVFNGISYSSSITVRDTLRSYQGCDSVYTITDILITPVTPVTIDSSIESCNPVVFNSITYNSSSIVKDTIPSALGCDSIYHVTAIIIIPVTPVTRTASIESCTDILFRGITYTASSIVRDTISSRLGCDSVYNITNIIITPVIAVTRNATIENCSAVTFNGVTYTSSTIVRDTTRSRFGCDSIYAITDIRITPVIAVTRNSTLEHCSAITFNGITYTSSTIVKDTLKSALGCDSIYNITDIIITPVVPASINATLEGCSSVIFNGTTYTASAIIRDTTRSRFGCDSVYNITTIIITPVIPVTRSASLEGCSSVIFNGTTYIASAIIRDTTRSRFGCDSVYNITNIIITPVVPVVLNNTLHGCNSLTFNGRVYTTSTIVKDTVQSRLGCDSVYNITQLDIIRLTPVTQSSTLRGCSSVVWNGSTYTGSVVLKDTIASIAGCDSVYVITDIVITPVLPVTHTTGLTGCSSVIFNGNTYTGSTTIRDTIVSFYGCDSIYNVTAITITPIIPVPNDKTITGCKTVLYNGTVYLSSTEIKDTTVSTGGCDSIYNTIKINVIPDTFVVQLTASANNVKPGTQILLNTLSSPGYSILSWQPYRVFNQQTAFQQQFIADTTTHITVTALSQEGCTAQASLLLVVKEVAGDVYFASAFNPYSTVGNNGFGPLGNLSGISHYSLEIYNRWGQIVFASGNPYQKWDGFYKGVINTGNFVWYAKYLYKGVTQRNERGNVLLIR